MSKSRKTVCPISRDEFRAKAQPVTITIGDVPMQVPAKEFSTGSLGWYLNNKTTIDIGGTPVTVQIGLNMTIVGSKELPGRPVAAADDEAPAERSTGT